MISLWDIANEYIDFHVDGKKVQIPYCIVIQPGEKKYKYTMGRTTKDANFAGKGRIEQIKETLYKVAEEKSFDLGTAKPEKITNFMTSEGIGIDCSGFVYNVLDKYLSANRKVSLSRFILRYPGILGKMERLILRNDRVRRSSAATLTSNLNTVKIGNVKDIKPGDMIRLTHPDWEGKHIVIIVKINESHIIYANSGEYTKIQGPHFGTIEIINTNKGLEAQKWLELTYFGENYGKIAFNPERGDSIRRLKYLSN